MDEVSQERVDDAWDEGFAHGYSRGNEEGLKIAFKVGYDFGAKAKTVSAEFVAEIEQLRKILSIVLEACEDVNSPDRKVREEITRTVRKALEDD
jgi:flagellar biosynthesis/type III secretory pathway protein FliH